MSVSAGLLEADVTERVVARLSLPKVRTAITAAVNALGTREEEEQRIAELKGRFERLGREYADGSIEVETMRAGTARVRANIASIGSRMAEREVLADLPEITRGSVLRWWEQSGPRQRRDVVSIFLDHVTVRPSEGWRRGPVDDRLDYAWKKH